MKNLFQKKQFFICMSIVFIGLMMFSFQKKGTFVDEMLTYDLSNRQSERVAFMQNYIEHSSFKEMKKDFSDLLEHGKKKSHIYQAYKAVEAEAAAKHLSVWRDSSYYSSFITAEKTAKFDFFSVMYNSIYDSAPPLYYYFIHFISSLFPGEFSLWFGLIVNILFLMLTAALLYKVTEKYFGGRNYAFLVSLCYIFSIGGLSTLYIIRMYAIYTFFILLFFAVNIKIAKNNFTFTHKTSLLYLLSVVLGFYTQYYFVLYAAFLVGCIIIYLASRQELRAKIPAYITTSLAAAILSFIVWPFSIKNIFFDSFGKETIQNAALGDFGRKLSDYFNIITDSLFINKTIFFLFAACLLAGGIYLYYNKYKTKQHTSSYKHVVSPKQLEYKTLMLFLFVPCLLYIIIVAYSSPFISDRYIMCAFPLILLFLYGMLRLVLSCLTRYHFCISSMIGAAVTILGLIVSTPGYIFPDQQEKFSIAADGSRTLCIYVSEDNGWQYKTALNLMSSCSQTAVIREHQTAELADGLPHKESYDRIVVLINSDFDQDSVMQKIGEACGFDPASAQVMPPENDEYATMYLVH